MKPEIESQTPPFRHFDMAVLQGEERYRLLNSSVVPRPIAWVVTCNAGGAVNAAPFSFFNVFGADRPVVALGLMPRPGGVKDTLANITETREFVVNLVPASLVASMNETCVDAPPGVDELALAGLKTRASVGVRPPRIELSPVAFECVVMHRLETGPNQFLIVGEIVHAHFAEAMLEGDPKRPRIRAKDLDLVGRMYGASAYTYTRDLFDLTRPSWEARPPNGAEPNNA